MTAIVLFAQSPLAFNYQAVIRDHSGELVTDQSVGAKVEIIKGSANGSVVYAETHLQASNAYGLISLEIGSGTSIDDFSAIAWGADTYFLRMSVDLNGGADYQLIGTSQLLSVPYALHARTAETVSGMVIESDPVYAASDAANITAGDIDKLGSLSGTNTGDQDLTGLASTAALEDTALAIRSSIPVSQGLSDVLIQSSSAGNSQIKDLADPTDIRDAVNMAYVALRVSTAGDTLFLGENQFVIITGISEANRPKVTDIEGNTYEIVEIGSQTWMAENLKTTKYNDGTDIPNVTDNTEWRNLTSPAYSWYNNDEATYAETYGALYNWHAVETSKLCPAGWHVPTRGEWQTLISYVGGIPGGGELKEAGTAHWSSPNTGATNESGFTGLPGGVRSETSKSFGINGLWWSSSGYSSTDSYSGMYLYHDTPDAHSGINVKWQGMSIRCISD